MFADDAVRLLRRRGRRARRLEDGFPEWQRAGLPVESARGDGVNVLVILRGLRYCDARASTASTSRIATTTKVVLLKAHTKGAVQWQSMTRS